MADYSNIEYDPDFFRGEDEDMFDYMQRLVDTREDGVLGTAAGVSPVAKEITEEPLGEVQQNCPVGYAWDGSKCVPTGDGDSGETVVPTKATLQQMIDAKTGRSLDPSALFGLFGPIGTAMGFAAQSVRDSELEKALIDSGMNPDMAKLAMQDPEYVAQQIYSGRVGDGKIEGVYRPSDAGKWNPVGGIVDSLFGVGGMFGAKEVPKDSSYVFDGGGYEYIPASTVFTPQKAQEYGFGGMGQGLISGMGAEGNRQYYITSDGGVRDVSALQDATQAGLKAVAAGTFDTPSWYEDDSDSGVTVGGPISSVPSFESSSTPSSSSSSSWADSIGSWF